MKNVQVRSSKLYCFLVADSIQYQSPIYLDLDLADPPMLTPDIFFLRARLTRKKYSFSTVKVQPILQGQFTLVPTLVSAQVDDEREFKLDFLLSLTFQNYNWQAEMTCAQSHACSTIINYDIWDILKAVGMTLES